MAISNNKRIAKNTLFLFIQTFVTLVVNLFAVRLILDALGAEDYGIQNVVGGVVTMFSFISSTMASAAQRYFAFEIGRNNYEKLNQLFNLTLLSYLAIVIVSLLVIEPVGMWLVNSKLVIPLNRLDAANWVFQLAVISFGIQMMVVPYTSLVIAQEKMSVFAIISVIDSILKLLIVYVLFVSNGDKLKLYAVYLFAVHLLNGITYIAYCRFHFKESRLKYYWNKSEFLSMIKYSGWYLYGTLASVVRSQGLNIIINLFFNPVVNAARAIAFQINGVINHFVNSYYQAVRPQITKYYSSDEHSQMMSLVISSSRISFYLFALVGIPVCIDAPYILSIWLKEVPNYTVIFTILVIVSAAIEVLGIPISTAVCASGKIKWYQIVNGSLYLLTIPVAYWVLKLGYPPQSVFVVTICLTFISLCCRIVFLLKQFGLSVKDYCKQVLLRIAPVLIISTLIPFFIHNLIDESFLRLCLTVIMTSFFIIITVFFIGIPKSERNYAITVVKKFLRRS